MRFVNKLAAWKNAGANVVALKFDFTTPSPENGYTGYSEIQVFGAASIPPAVATTVGASLSAPDSIVMNVGGMIIGRTYEVQSTTNLMGSVWIAETNFVAVTTSTNITSSVTGSNQKYFRINGY